MADLIVKSLEQPEETHAPSEKGRVDLVTLGEVTVGRACFQPGWQWTREMRSHAGTDLCQVSHTGYVVSGRSIVRMADGTEVELGPGDAYVIEPGHDAWVVGDDRFVGFEFETHAAEDFARG